MAHGVPAVTQYFLISITWFWIVSAWIPSPLFRSKMFRTVGDFILHTGPTTSLRHILYNGWGFEMDEVLVGFTTLAKFSGVLLIVFITSILHILWGYHYGGVILRVISKVVKERIRSQRSQTEV